MPLQIRSFMWWKNERKEQDNEIDGEESRSGPSHVGLISSSVVRLRKAKGDVVEPRMSCRPSSETLHTKENWRTRIEGRRWERQASVIYSNAATFLHQGGGLLQKRRSTLLWPWIDSHEKACGATISFQWRCWVLLLNYRFLKLLLYFDSGYKRNHVSAYADRNGVGSTLGLGVFPNKQSA